MLKILIALLVSFSLSCEALPAKPIVIAVIDTGIDTSVANLCATGHKSFSSTGSNPLTDEVGHGTHIAGLINMNAGQGNYCMVSVKYYNYGSDAYNNSNNLVMAIKYAISINADFINISSGGVGANEPEREVIELALNKHIRVVVAAGNNGTDLDNNCNYFPACYDKRIVIVGNLMSPGRRAFASNFGNRVTRWEIGTGVLSSLPGGKMGYMSGTSQATAIATGKLVAEAIKG